MNGPHQPPIERRAAEVVCEWIESIAPCHCHPAYVERGLVEPDCLMHDLVADADTVARDLREEGLLR